MAKAKSSKSFYAPRARFWEFVESRVDSASSWNLGWILRNCRIAGGFEFLRERGFYFLHKQKVAKAFKWLCYAQICFVDTSATLSPQYDERDKDSRFV